MFDSDILPDDMSHVSTVGHIKHQSTTLIGEIARRKLQPQSSCVVKRLGSWKIDPFFFLPFKDIKGSIKKSLHHSFALDLVPLSLPFLLFFWGLATSASSHRSASRLAARKSVRRSNIMLITAGDKRWQGRFKKKKKHDSDLILQLAVAAHR